MCLAKRKRIFNPSHWHSLSLLSSIPLIIWRSSSPSPRPFTSSNSSTSLRHNSLTISLASPPPHDIVIPNTRPTPVLPFPTSKISRLFRSLPTLRPPRLWFRNPSAMAAPGSYYGRERFDPILILAQIALLQACFYLSYLVLLLIFNYATGTSANIRDQIFNHTYITLRHFPGWVTCTALLVSAIGPTSLAFVAVVGRAKRCVDFASTLLIAHITATTMHSGFPMNVMWWVLNIIAAAGLAFVGEALSMRIELRDISVSRSDATNASESRRPGKKDSSRDLEAALDSVDPGNSTASDVEKSSLMNAS